MPTLTYLKESIIVPGPAEPKTIIDNLPSQLLEGKELMYAVAFRVIKSLQEHAIIGSINYVKDDGERITISKDTEIPYEIETKEQIDL